MFDGEFFRNNQTFLNNLNKFAGSAIKYFHSPIELYVKTESGQLTEYQSLSGQVSCKWQTWFAAALLDFIN